MSGYRDSSNYDPYASPRYGRPLRPYNWVQWTGVAFVLVGIAIDLSYFAGRLGWIPRDVTPLVALLPIMSGAILVNSRREIVVDPAPELAAERKRALIVVSLLCIFVFAVAIALAFFFDL
jgi:hypothetical protein